MYSDASMYQYFTAVSMHKLKHYVLNASQYCPISNLEGLGSHIMKMILLLLMTKWTDI